MGMQKTKINYDVEGKKQLKKKKTWKSFFFLKKKKKTVDLDAIKIINHAEEKDGRESKK